MTRQAAAYVGQTATFLKEQLRGLHNEMVLQKDPLRRESLRYRRARCFAALLVATRGEEAQFAAGALEEFENEGGQNGNL